jgi:hypothetical protein
MIRRFRAVSRVLLFALAASTLASCCFHHGHYGRIRFCVPVPHCR